MTEAINALRSKATLLSLPCRGGGSGKAADGGGLRQPIPHFKLFFLKEKIIREDLFPEMRMIKAFFRSPF